MLTDDLKQLAQKIIDQLNRDRASTTQKWMAHYIAELMHRAETNDDPNIIAETEKLCSEIIIQLWKVDIEWEKLRIQQRFYAELRETYKEYPAADHFRQIIENPELIEEIEEGIHRYAILIFLNDVENDLLRLRIFGDILGHTERTLLTEETLDKANEFLHSYQITIQNLKDIWLEVEEISVKDIDSIHSFVYAKFHHIQQLRGKLLQL